MTDQVEQTEMEAAEKAAQLSALKSQADLLDVKYAQNIGAETLAERVRAAKEKLQPTEAVEGEKEPDLVVTDPETHKQVVVPADIESKYAVFHAKQLIRVSVTCVNPAKADIPSDLYTVYSSSLGRVSQVIPHQAPKGTHIPRCLVDFLKTKKFLAFRPTGLKKGEVGCNREYVEMNEFIIRELPPLTFDEFKSIVERQDRAAAINIEDY